MQTQLQPLDLANSQQIRIVLVSNPGNSGHRGYKMSKVMAIEPQGDLVIISLECGHVQRWTPDLTRTAEEWVKQIQEGSRPVVIGKTRLRCESDHNKEREAPTFAQGACPNCGHERLNMP